MTSSAVTSFASREPELISNYVTVQHTAGVFRFDELVKTQVFFFRGMSIITEHTHSSNVFAETGP